MSYADFIILQENELLRNIFSNEELAKTGSMKDVKTYHKEFCQISKDSCFFTKYF